MKYIMVDGVALNLHGYHRTTADIDVWIEDTQSNRKNLRTAFKDLGLGDFEALERMEFIPGWTYFHLNNGLRIDIMTDLKGFEQYTFNQCLDLASVAAIFEVEVPFLHINHLLQAKKAAGRPKDQVDIIALEKIKEIREREQNQ